MTTPHPTPPHYILLRACPKGPGKMTGHHFATNSILTWSCIMWFLSLLPFERKAKWPSISTGWDHHCHKVNRAGPSYKHLSAVFPAAIPTLVGRLHSSQWQLFWRRMWTSERERERACVRGETNPQSTTLLTAAAVKNCVAITYYAISGEFQSTHCTSFHEHCDKW
jgi:hypothetical protein